MRSKHKAKSRANKAFTDKICSLAFRIRMSLYAPKQQEYDQHQNDETQTTAGVVSPPRAIRPCGQSTERNREQNHNQYGNHMCIRPLSRAFRGRVWGLSTSARALDIRSAEATIRAFV